MRSEVFHIAADKPDLCPGSPRCSSRLPQIGLRVIEPRHPETARCENQRVPSDAAREIKDIERSPDFRVLDDLPDLSLGPPRFRIEHHLSDNRLEEIAPPFLLAPLLTSLIAKLPYVFSAVRWLPSLAGHEHGDHSGSSLISNSRASFSLATVLGRRYPSELIILDAVCVSIRGR